MSNFDIAGWKVGDKFIGYEYRTFVDYKLKSKIHRTNTFNEDTMPFYIGKVGIIEKLEFDKNLVKVRFSDTEFAYYPVMKSKENTEKIEITINVTDYTS